MTTLTFSRHILIEAFEIAEFGKQIRDGVSKNNLKPNGEFDNPLLIFLTKAS